MCVLFRFLLSNKYIGGCIFVYAINCHKLKDTHSTQHTHIRMTHVSQLVTSYKTPNLQRVNIRYDAATGATAAAQ